MSNYDSDKLEADEPGDLEAENARLKHQLNVSTCKIMRLQGTADTTDRITDVMIGKRIEALQHSIQQWINKVEENLLDQHQDFGKIFYSSLEGEKKLWICHVLGLRVNTNLSEDAEWIIWLSNLGTCIYVVLGRCIWWYLQDEIFSRKFPIGVDNTLTSTFNDILSVMGNMSRDQDSTTLTNKWRSSTITSFTRTDGFKKQKKSHLGKLPKALRLLLSTWVESDILENHYQNLKDTVINEAVELHQKIACSSYEYFVSMIKPPDLIRGAPPHCLKSVSWTLKDVFKWRLSHGNMVDVFMCFSPGIYKQGVPGEEPVQAAPPVILVYDCPSSQIPPVPKQLLQAQLSNQKGFNPPSDLSQKPRTSPRQSSCSERSAKTPGQSNSPTPQRETHESRLNAPTPSFKGSLSRKPNTRPRYKPDAGYRPRDSPKISLHEDIGRSRKKKATVKEENIRSASRSPCSESDSSSTHIAMSYPPGYSKQKTSRSPPTNAYRLKKALLQLWI